VRTKRIISRVKRVLRSFGITNILNKELLYDAQRGIDRIYASALLQKTITITIQEGVTTYPLNDSNVKSVGTIENIEYPSDWQGMKIEFVSKEEWADKIHHTSQLMGIFHDGSLEIYPAPTASLEGKVLKMRVVALGSMATLELTPTNNPDIPEIFDDALEYYIEMKNLGGRDKAEYMALYNAEIDLMRPVYHRKLPIIYGK